MNIIHYVHTNMDIHFKILFVVIDYSYGWFIMQVID